MCVHYTAIHFIDTKKNKKRNSKNENRENPNPIFGAVSIFFRKTSSSCCSFKKPLFRVDFFYSVRLLFRQRVCE